MLVLYLGLVYVFELCGSIWMGIWCRLAHLSCTLKGVGLAWSPELYTQGDWIGMVCGGGVGIAGNHPIGLIDP